MYLSSAQASYTISRNNTASVQISLRPLTGALLGIAINSTSNTSSSHTYSNLSAGYYIFQIDGTFTTINYQSDPYACPYDPSFPDTKLLFAPCLSNSASASSASSSGMPIEQIALIGACAGVFVVSAVGLLIYLLKAKASNVTP